MGLNREGGLKNDAFEAQTQRERTAISERGDFMPRAEMHGNFEVVHMAGGPDHRDAFRVLGRKAGRWEFPEGWENDPRNKPAQELREKRAHTVRTIQSICAYLTGAGLMSLFQGEGARFASSAFAPFAQYTSFFLIGVALSRWESTMSTKGAVGLIGTTLCGFAGLAGMLTTLVATVSTLTGAPALVGEAAAFWAGFYTGRKWKG
ncbi:hypothetical protein K2X83_00290 [Patescibacteria group bacterium]|nr:hypothetical protein [Patescibacteria group bacterium]